MSLTAHRIEKRRLHGGNPLETLVDTVATAILIIGVLCVLGLLLTFSIPGFITASSVLIAAFLQWILLRCVAEHLRLQKKIAGCKYEGRITGPNEETIGACSNCGIILHSDVRCDGCGAEIVPRGE